MVKHIDFKGKEIPYSVSFLALKGFKKVMGFEYEDTPKEKELEALEEICYQAIVAGCREEEVEEIPIKREDIDLFLNTCMMEFQESIPDFFQTPPSKEIKKETKRPTGGGKNTTKKKP